MLTDGKNIQKKTKIENDEDSVCERINKKTIRKILIVYKFNISI